MTLLVEYRVLDNLKVINEGTGTNKKLKIKGKFQKCDEVNNNGRIYPRKVLESQVTSLQDKISERSLVGALDHPANEAIHLSQASHLITKVWVEKNGDVMGEAEILSTPSGKIVEALLNDNVKIGISSRGIGTVSESKTGRVVNEDFRLITFDLVSDPSTKGAYGEITESVKKNSLKAQEIVKKAKAEQIFLTSLEQKINERLDETSKHRKKLLQKLQGNDVEKFSKTHYNPDNLVRYNKETERNYRDSMPNDVEATHVRKVKHELRRGKKTKGKFTENKTYSNLVSLIEGLVKKANKAKKRRHETTIGGSSSHTLHKKYKERIENAKTKATNPKKDPSIGTRLNAGDRALARAIRKNETMEVYKRINSLVEDMSCGIPPTHLVEPMLTRLTESKSTKKDRETIKLYLIKNLQYICDSYPVNYSDPKDKSWYQKEMKDKIKTIRSFLDIIEGI